jgi:hypothetical protein
MMCVELICHLAYNYVVTVLSNLHSVALDLEEHKWLKGSNFSRYWGKVSNKKKCSADVSIDILLLGIN